MRPNEARTTSVATTSGALALAVRRAWGIGPAWRFVALYTALFLGWRFRFLPQAPEDAVWLPLLSLPPVLVAAGCALAAALRRAHSSRARTGWAFVAAGLLLAAAGQAAQRLGHASPLLGAAAAPVLASVSSLFLAAGLAWMPVALRGASDGLGGILDAGIVLLAGGLAVLRWSPLASAGAPRAEDLVPALRLLPDLLVLAAAVRLALRRPAGASPLAAGLLCAALAVRAAVEPVRALVPAGTGALAGALDLLGALAGVALVAGAEEAGRGVSVGAPAEVCTPRRAALALRALASVVGGLLVLLALGVALPSAPATAAGVCGLAGLLVAREVIGGHGRARLLAEQADRGQDGVFRSLVVASGEAVIILADDRVVRYASPAAADLFGWRGVNLVGRRLGDLLPPEHDSGVHEQVDRAMVVAATPPTDWRVRRPDESWAHVECRITNLLGDAAVRGLVLHLRDVADRRAHETALVRQAFHDTLTGLPNRTLFLDRLTHSLKLGTRRFSRIAVLFGDLDRFKHVNDEFGHAQGDLLLRAAADRMTRCVRESDTVARFGGDEFGVLLEDLASSSDAQATASRLVRAFDAPFSVGGREYRVGLSLGVALEAAGDTVDSLLHDADVAMYAAKRRGGSRWVLYETELEAQKDEAHATTRRDRAAE